MSICNWRQALDFTRFLEVTALVRWVWADTPVRRFRIWGFDHGMDARSDPQKKAKFPSGGRECPPHTNKNASVSGGVG